MNKDFTKEELLKIIAEKDALLGKNNALLSEKDTLINKLQGEIAWLKRKVFGRMSEKFVSEDPQARQLDLFGDILTEQEQQEISQATQKEDERLTRTIKVKKSRTPRKDPSLENLREEVQEIYPVQKDDPRYECIGEDVTKKLAFNPGEIYVKVIKRKKYALKESLQGLEETSSLKSVVIAELPKEAINKSLADSTLLSEIILQKFLYHMPFHRQIQMFKNLGVNLSSSTIGDWFSATCEALKPIYDRLRQEVLATDYIQVDESTIQVVDDGKGKTKKGYIWVVRDPIKGNVFFHYDNGSRSGETARVLLSKFNGAIQTDGYQAYNQFESQNGKLLLGCWAHARRGFENSLDENRTLASEALVQIKELYDIERQAAELGLNYDEIAKLRSEKAYPLLVRFEKWLVDNHSKVLRQSRTGKAIEYAYSIFPRLSRYHLDGRYKMDNNLVENSVRPLAIGRKNYLFCGNNQAACRAAIIYSLIGSCKAMDVNPHNWMSYVLNNIATIGDITQLLPENYKNLIKLR